MRMGRGCATAVLVLACIAFAQQPATRQKANPGKESNVASTDAQLEDLLESKVKAEWEALKKRDKKMLGDLLADDFVAVEDDGDGARNKIHTVNEVDSSNVHNYTMSFFKLLPLAPDAAFVTYEVTMEFPPKAVVRFKRIYISEVWLKRDGQWKARYYQETRVK